MKSTVDFEEYNRFKFAGSSEWKCGADFERIRSVVLFRHGQRTPCLYSWASKEATDILDTPYGKSGTKQEIFKDKEKWLYKNVAYTQVSDGKPYEIDSNLNFDTIANPWAQLTTEGARQLYRLGQGLRDRYSQELKELLNTADSKQVSSGLKNVFALSSGFERTIDSLRALLLGLLGEECCRKVELSVLETVEVNWLIVPHPKHPSIIKGEEHAKSMDFKNTLPGFSDWSKSMSERTGLPEETEIIHIRDYVVSYCELEGAAHLNLGFTPEDREKSERFCTYLCSAEVLAIENGVALACSLLFSNLVKCLENEDNILYLLSCHDTTMNQLRLGLKAQDYSWPDFAANVTFELYQQKDTSSKFLVVLYGLKPIILEAICADVMIPWHSFLDFVHKNLSIVI